MSGLNKEMNSVRKSSENMHQNNDDAADAQHEANTGVLRKHTLADKYKDASKCDAVESPETGVSAGAIVKFPAQYTPRELANGNLAIEMEYVSEELEPSPMAIHEYLMERNDMVEVVGYLADLAYRSSDNQDPKQVKNVLALNLDSETFFFD